MNGAGKSTLLKILTGTTTATTGSVQLSGRVAALLELGTGFHPELNGLDNVLINGKLLGLTEHEIRSKLNQIEEFAELGEYFLKPVRTYSSGMYVRLAFALASSVEPDVLIIDEALSVGDAYFQQKCLKRIMEFRDRGTTILFVSHDLGSIKMLCDQVVLLDRGTIIDHGDPVKVLETYNALLARKDGHGSEYSVKRVPRSDGTEVTTSGNLKAEILSARLLDAESNALSTVVTSSIVTVDISIRFHVDMQNPTIGFLIRDRLSYDVFGTNTAEMHVPLGFYAKNSIHRFRFELPLHLGPGEYTLTVAAHSDRTHVDDCYQWVDRILSFKVIARPDYRFIGVAALQARFLGSEST
jgi:lipopolysaccharide transport system ATP-binding protein